MKRICEFFKKSYKEIFFQICLITLMFLFFSFQQDGTEKIESYKISFFCNYMFAALVINYGLFPFLYYKGKKVLFFISLIALVTIVILVDEFVLEKIYFPETRGKYFPGVFFTLMETLPVIIIFSAFKFAWDHNIKQKKIDELKVLVRDSELNFLKSQINPHFLFNNLNNLYSYAIANSEKTPRIVLELSSVLRYMIYDCRENYVDINKEIEHLKNYTALNELQIEDRGDIIFNANIQSSKFLIAPLILNVFIENAFKHSMANQTNNIKIEIIINLDGKGVLTFFCKNNFSSVSKNEKSTYGVGLVNVKKRLDLIYPNVYKLKITEEKNEYSVMLKLQLNSKVYD